MKLKHSISSFSSSVFSLSFLSVIILSGSAALAENIQRQQHSIQSTNGSNTSELYDNRDPRTNSKSTPASMGSDRRQLSADITQEGYQHDQSQKEYQWKNDNSQAALAGSSTPITESSTYSEDTVYETSNEPRLSGSSTSPSASSPSGKTKTQSTVDSPAAGAAIGTAAVGTDNKESSSSLSGASNAVSSTSAQDKGLTAQDTAQSATANELVRKIRSEITNDQKLSMNAHNVKIISDKNNIYLKGPVMTASEKAKVEKIAKRVAGKTKVINETYVEKK